jgi:hypothetical protein
VLDHTNVWLSRYRFTLLLWFVRVIHAYMCRIILWNRIVKRSRFLSIRVYEVLWRHSLTQNKLFHSVVTSKSHFIPLFYIFSRSLLWCVQYATRTWHNSTPHERNITVRHSNMTFFLLRLNCRYRLLLHCVMQKGEINFLWAHLIHQALQMQCVLTFFVIPA